MYPFDSYTIEEAKMEQKLKRIQILSAKIALPPQGVKSLLDYVQQAPLYQKMIYSSEKANIDHHWVN